MTGERVAVYAGTRNLYHDMTVSARSLMYHHGADRVVFLTEDDDFTEQLPVCVEVLNVSGQTWFRHDGPNYRSPWTYMVMMRTVLTKLFPHLDRVLTLDHDAIVHQDIGGLWDADLTGYYYAAVEESLISNRTKPYYNCGVLLHNLRLLREDGADDVIVRSLNSVHFTYCEQDAINSVCGRRILSLPQEYNAMWHNQPDIDERDIRIRHHAARNKCMCVFPDYQVYDRMSWEEALNGEP